MVSIPSSTKFEQNQMKSIIGNSYNKLYCQFMSEELCEVGNYKILKRIGEGSFGKVYLACHKPTHRKVVLKTSDKNDPNVVREVFYHRQFDYIYITKLYEVIVTETKVWMALEYCPGKELYEHLLSLHRIPLDEAAKLFAQICGAVYYAHSLNCVHRDLKLENILLDKKGNAKLADFGFTRECVAKGSLETICGTTVYMAPELTQRKNYDGFKIDIWSLGVILYTMINGTMPFDEDDDAKTKWKIVHDMPEFNSNIMDENSIDLISQLLGKDPSERPSMQKILSHPFLQPYGIPVLEKTKKILSKQRRGLTQFHSRTERKLLKRLKQLGFDTQSIKASVHKRKCDSLSGLWLLLMEREKACEVSSYPKRSRSVLSVRKVLDAASITDGLQIEEGFLSQHLDSKLAAPLSRIMSRKSDSISVVAPSPRKKLIEPQALQQIDSSGINRLNNDPPSNCSTPKKNNIFSKMTKFFKNKKNSSDTTQLTNSRQRQSDDSQKTRNSPVSPPGESKGLYEKKRANRSDSSKSMAGSTSQNTPKDHDMDYLDDSVPHASTSIQILEKPKEGVRQLKRFKSITSSDISRQTSTGNYDSESLTNPLRRSDENLKSGIFTRVRPISGISQHSEISNETFNSEYSTDGNTSSFKMSDSNKSSLPLSYTGGVPQDSGMNQKTSGNNQKIARRDLSIMSSASSASERSSRTDSFYDITTASSPMMMDVRNIKRSSIKDSVLPRFGKQTSWMNKRNPGSGRRSVLNRRNHGRDLLSRKSSHQQSIIKEESSSGGDDDRNDAGIILPLEGSVDEADELAVHSDSEAPCASSNREHVNLPKISKRASFMCVRSLSEGSDLSQNYTRLSGDLTASPMTGEDDVLSRVADREDNASD